MTQLRPAKPLSEFEINLLRQQAFKIIRERSFKKGRFVLASGKESGYYLDMKPSMFSPDGSKVLSELILESLRDERVDYIGGLELGAVPLVSTITMLSEQRNTPLPGFFVRKKVKDHGTKKLIEGLVEGQTLHGKRVVVLEDVTTTGGSAMEAVAAAQNDGANVLLVMSVVDREEGAAALYQSKGVRFRALFTASEFMNA
jgi:orotate phosphoribosyltransferase